MKPKPKKQKREWKEWRIVWKGERVGYAAFRSKVAAALIAAQASVGTTEKYEIVRVSVREI